MKFKVKVIPNSKREEIIEDRENGIITVRVKEKPEKGKATLKVIKMLEEYFHKPVNLLKGAFSREKIIEVE
ncbi:MAG: DUF167 domain-containing protein [Candidatus Micrarchaeia archaeon]